MIPLCFRKLIFLVSTCNNKIHVSQTIFWLLTKVRSVLESSEPQLFKYDIYLQVRTNLMAQKRIFMAKMHIFKHNFFFIFWPKNPISFKEPISFFCISRPPKMPARHWYAFQRQTSKFNLNLLGAHCVQIWVAAFCLKSSFG